MITISTTCKHGRDMMLQGCSVCANDFSSFREAGKKMADETHRKVYEIIKSPTKGNATMTATASPWTAHDPERTAEMEEWQRRKAAYARSLPAQLDDLMGRLAGIIPPDDMVVLRRVRAEMGTANA